MASVLSILSAFGLGGIVGAVANHFLARRREQHQEARARHQEDRELVLKLGDVVGPLRRRFGGKRSLYLTDARKDEWGTKEKSRAREFSAALDDVIGSLERIERALNDRAVAGMVGWTKDVVTAAAEVLAAAAPSPAAQVVVTCLKDADGSAHAFLQGRRQPMSTLRKAWDAEAGLFAPVPRVSAQLFRRVDERYTTLRRQRIAARRPSLARMLEQPTFFPRPGEPPRRPRPTVSRPAGRSIGGTERVRPRRRLPPPDA